ncbi:MAG TPA: tetratricopeptide repeat protein [Polyangia bacterium]|jgi:tetratricopeptide (TPR) repeat protein|nr:tetratricopeptide repeat protein [Polyangia bacterium]
MRTQVENTMKKNLLPTRLGQSAGMSGLALGLALTLSACGSTQIPSSQSAGGEDGLIGGENKPNASEIIPKEAKRQISADARADFEKATKQYLEAKKSGGLSGSECRSVANAFKNAADENPALVEARFNQGAVLAECGKEDDAISIWEKMPKYGPAIANLGYVAWKNGDTGKAESYFMRAIDVDPLHTVEARNNLAQILRDKARRAGPDEKKQYVQQAVSNLRTVLAIDSNNLQAFSTLAFIYYDMNMLEMAKLVGNQAIKKADEIATGKFEEEKQPGGDAEDGKGKGKGKGAKGKGKEKEGDEPGVKSVDVREAGTGVTPEMKKQLAVVHNTLGLVELKKKNISPAIKQFKDAVALDPTLAEARLNLAALSLNNRDYGTAEENFREALKMQPKNYEAAIGLGVALRGNKKIDDAESQYKAAQKLDSANPSSYYNLGLLYQDYKDGQKPALHQAQDYYRQFLSHATGSTPDGLKRDAEKRIKDIDEIYVALDEAAKMQAEAEEMQKKAEEQQKQMEEQMKKQEAQEAADKAAAEKAKAGGDAKPGTEPPAATAPAAPGTDGASAPADGGGKKKGKKK